jgi:hypothetical protein
MKPSNEIDKLVNSFVDSVIQQTDAIARGDAVTGNKFAKRYIGAFEKLCAFGDIGRDALFAQFHHPRADVRVTAASFLLRYKTDAALRLLRAEAENLGLAAFEASQAIERWQDGDWSLDLQ